MEKAIFEYLTEKYQVNLADNTLTTHNKLSMKAAIKNKFNIRYDEGMFYIKKWMIKTGLKQKNFKIITL